jgi:hypothetical protein
MPAAAPAATVAQAPVAAPTAPATVPQLTALHAHIGPAPDAAVVDLWLSFETSSTAVDAAARFGQWEPAGAPHALWLRRLHRVSAPLAARTRPGSPRDPAKESSPAQDNATGLDAPSGPPGHATAGSNGAALGGISSGHWCAILAGVVAFSYQRSYRRRLRPVLQGPGGVGLLLQRPG